MKTPKTKWIVAVATDQGLVRLRNEDCVKFEYGDADNTSVLFAGIADGMGGLKDGHQASQIAVNTAIEQLKRNWAKTPVELRKTLHLNAIAEAHGQIQKASRLKHGANQKMGSTLITIVIDDLELSAASIGDSALFLGQRGTMASVFEPDRVVGTANILKQCIGGSIVIAPTAHSTELSQIEVLLACTDGVSDVLSIQDIEQLSKNTEPEHLPHILVEAAKRAGSEDNLTALCIAKVESS